MMADVTGLRLTTIDDRLGCLLDNGRIHRVQRGVFVPSEQHRPARPISRTLLPDGTTVLEIGDDTMHLSPREARMLGEVMAGSAAQFAAIEIGHQAARQSSVLQGQISEVRRDVMRIVEASEKRV